MLHRNTDFLEIEFSPHPHAAAEEQASRVLWHWLDEKEYKARPFY